MSDISVAQQETLKGIEKGSKNIARCLNGIKRIEQLQIDIDRKLLGELTTKERQSALTIKKDSSVTLGECKEQVECNKNLF